MTSLIVEDVEVGHWIMASHRVFEDGRVVVVVPGIFNGLLCVSSAAAWRRGDRDDVFTYVDVAGAREALEAWDGSGEPGGWTRHQPSNRRRPGGDPSCEFVAS